MMVRDELLALRCLEAWSLSSVLVLTYLGLQHLSGWRLICLLTLSAAVLLRVLYSCLSRLYDAASCTMTSWTKMLWRGSEFVLWLILIISLGTSMVILISPPTPKNSWMRGTAITQMLHLTRTRICLVTSRGSQHTSIKSPCCCISRIVTI